MAERANNQGEPVGQKSAPERDDPPLPSSKPLQIFLLVALLITVAAFAEDQWMRITNRQNAAPGATSLRHLVEFQSEYLEHTEKGRAALQKSQLDAAVAEFRLALQFENWAEGHENLGRALLLKHDPKAALEQFREGSKLEPNRVSLYLLWGEVLAGEGRSGEAAGVFENGLKHDADNGEIHYQLARTFQSMERDAQTQVRLDVSASQPAAAATARAQASTFAAEALRHYVKASRNKVDTAAFWLGYGELLNEQGKYADARNALSRAVGKDATMARAFTQLARAQENLGQYAGAIGNYEKALTLSPDNPQTLNDLALLYVTAREPAARSSRMGVLLATRACDATTNQNARFMDTLARAYAADGDFFQAITWEEKAVYRTVQLRDYDLQKELEKRYSLFVDHKNE